MYESVVGVTTEVLETLRQDALTAASLKNIVEFRRVPELGETKVAAVMKDGYELLDVIAPRKNVIADFLSIPAWVAHLIERGHAAKSMVVWVSLSRIEMMLNDDTREQPMPQGRMELCQDVGWQMMQTYAEKPVWHTQKEFVSLLKYRLGKYFYPEKDAPSARLLTVAKGGTIDPARYLIDTFSVLRFESRKTTGGSVLNGADFLGREAANEASSGPKDKPIALPEVITLYVPVFQDHELRWRYPVQCEVRIDFDECKFALLPNKADLADIELKAVRDADEALESRLPPDVTVLIGRDK